VSTFFSINSIISIELEDSAFTTDRTSLVISWILDAEALELSDSFLISSATTANPFPVSPALAASIAALRASKVVWEVISRIVLDNSLI